MSNQEIKDKTGMGILTLLQLKTLWDKSLGHPDICVAILDGPVDRSHPCFNGANLTGLPSLVSGVADLGSGSQPATDKSDQNLEIDWILNATLTKNLVQKGVKA
ncbi:MAG: hypothetical protein QNJ70_07810 [Xenococcaceae cyanobacterium MO_207.B15]|nr:hypothetical protein [Xenococcaceae cyanobacterium MO_207.B15]